MTSSLDLSSKRMDISGAFQGDAKSLDFVLPGLLSGTVGGLVAPGGTGKSFWALEAAMGIALAVAGGNLLGLNQQVSGRVVYIAKEDPEVILYNRINAIGPYLKPENWELISENMDILPLIGTPVNIMEEGDFEKIGEYSEGARIIIIDTIRRLHTFNENDNGAMAALMDQLEVLAKTTGASILFLHHVNKSSGRDGNTDQFSARGASVLVDNARWGAGLAKMTEKESQEWSDSITRKSIGEKNRNWYVKMVSAKLNYSEPLEDRWFRRADGGVLVPANLTPAVKEERKTDKREKHNSSTSPSNYLSKKKGEDDDWW
ncbi:helicase RepA family protein [Acidithiobacillus sp. M4-SHS-6]|uniref:helicase RepA family protein n=1 Tax=Acidithiobacillus sp. M4-SHS-6 TaxID=3383024 RepID=UPI0039BE2FB5